MRSREEIQAQLDALGAGDSNDAEIDQLRDIIEELLDERTAATRAVQLRAEGVGGEIKLVKSERIGVDPDDWSDEAEEEFDNLAKSEDWEAIDALRGQGEAFDFVLRILRVEPR